MRFVLTLLLAALAVLPFNALRGQQSGTDASAPNALLSEQAEAVVAAIKGERAVDQVFGPQFLAAVPPEQLNAISAQLTQQFGELIGVEKVEPDSEFSGTIYLRFERAIGSGKFAIAPEAPNLVTGLVLQNFEPIDDGLEKIRADLEALPGEVSVLFSPLDTSDGVTFRTSADQQLAIGSTFKLYVLLTLASQIEDGDRKWDDVVPLDVSSFPSGVLQDWPQGTPMTLQTLASLMISISDNTATDQLIRVLGREAIEARIAETGSLSFDRMQPLLSTLDLFKLKGDAALRDRWAGLDREGKMAELAAFEAEHNWKADTVTPPTFVEPTAIDTLEWFASDGDLMKLMRALLGTDDPTVLEIMAINPSLPPALREKWPYAGFKGGSEPGVLNLTWLLRDRSGAWHILAMTWNNRQANVDTATFEMLAQRLLSLPD